MDSIQEINTKIEGLMKKYKLTLYVMVACIAVYLICLFWLKNIWVVLAVCVPMLACAFVNSRLSKQIRNLVAKRTELENQEKMEQQAEAQEKGELEELQVGENNFNEPIVANAKSLNDLPKEYTVMDKVELNGEEIPHIILSPYGVAIVDSLDQTAPMEAILSDLQLESPVFMYEPQEDIALLAEKIQMPKDVVLTEPDIYKILYRLSGLQ